MINIRSVSSKKTFFAIVTFILVIIICSITLYVNPIVGMADNGDFFRIISQNNLYNLVNIDQSNFLQFFNKEFGIYKYFNDNQKMIVSTQSLLIRIAVFFDTLITKDYIFDIRFLSFIYMIVFAIAMYFIVKVFTHDIDSFKGKTLITVLIIFAFCDTGYVAYFNSFYGEAVCFSFFLLSIGILLYMYEFKKVSMINIVLFFLTSIIFIGSKQQLAPIGILIAIILVRLNKLTHKKSFRYMAMGLAIATLFSSLYFYKSITGDFDYINRYYAMTRGVLIYEKDSESLLEEFGINPQYSLLQESIYFGNIPVINPSSEKMKEEFYSKYSFTKILVFYIKHPKIFLKMLRFSVENAYTIKNKVIGNYEKTSGKKPKEQTKFFTAWSYVKDKFIPHNLFFTIILAGVYFGYAIKRYIKGLKSNEISSLLFEEAFVYIFLVGVSQLVVSVIGAGDGDLGKHVFMFNVVFDIMLLYSLKLIIKSEFKACES